jgi:hypothetical protein
MYKIITDITVLDKLNLIVQNMENNSDVNYSDAIKHPIRAEWLIPIDENLLKIYNPTNLDYLLSDNIETIPSDWNWPYQECIIRITIPNYLILSNVYLKSLIQYCDANDVKSIVDKENSIVYVNYILPEHQQLFNMFSEIKIETK